MKKGEVRWLGAAFYRVVDVIDVIDGTEPGQQIVFVAPELDGIPRPAIIPRLPTDNTVFKPPPESSEPV